MVEKLKAWENYVVVVDETSSIQNRQTLNTGLEWLMRQAPDTVDVIQTTHRLVDTQRLVRALATDIFIFQTTLQADLDTIRDEMGEEVADEVSKLGQYQVLHYWLDVAGVPRWCKWENPEDWYVRIR